MDSNLRFFLNIVLVIFVKLLLLRSIVIRLSKWSSTPTFIVESRLSYKRRYFNELSFIKVFTEIFFMLLLSRANLSRSGALRKIPFFNTAMLFFVVEKYCKCDAFLKFAGKFIQFDVINVN